MRHIDRLILLTLVLAFAFGCAQQQNPAVPQPSTPPGAEARAYTVAIQEFVFNPLALTIKKGDSVAWANGDVAPHSIAFDVSPVSGQPGVTSEVFGKGKSFTFTFNEKGIFEYYCGVHPSMRGKITVE